MAALVRHAGSALGQASGKLLDKQEVVSSSLLPPLQAFVAVLLPVAQVNILTRKLSKGARWEQYCWNPLLQENTSLVRLACMMKYETYTSTEMEGLWGDHNNGDGGWDSLDFSKIQVVPAGH